jgi:hypothetical protein
MTPGHAAARHERRATKRKAARVSDYPASRIGHVQDTRFSRAVCDAAHKWVLGFFSSGGSGDPQFRRRGLQLSL